MNPRRSRMMAVTRQCCLNNFGSASNDASMEILAAVGSSSFQISHNHLGHLRKLTPEQKEQLETDLETADLLSTDDLVRLSNQDFFDSLDEEALLKISLDTKDTVVDSVETTSISDPAMDKEKTTRKAKIQLLKSEATILLSSINKKLKLINTQPKEIEQLKSAKERLENFVDNVGIFAMPDNQYRVWQIIKKYTDRNQAVELKNELKSCNSEKDVAEWVEGKKQPAKNGLTKVDKQAENKSDEVKDPLLPMENLELLRKGKKVPLQYPLSTFSLEQLEELKFASLTNTELLAGALNQELVDHNRYIQEIHARLLRQDGPQDENLSMRKVLKERVRSAYDNAIVPISTSWIDFEDLLKTLSGEINQQIKKIDEYVNKSLQEEILSKSIYTKLTEWSKKKDQTKSISKKTSEPTIDNILTNSKRIVDFNKTVKSISFAAEENQQKINTSKAVVATLISLTGVGFIFYTLPKMIESKMKYGTVLFTHVTPEKVAKRTTKELTGHSPKSKKKR